MNREIFLGATTAQVLQAAFLITVFGSLFIWIFIKYMIYRKTEFLRYEKLFDATYLEKRAKYPLRDENVLYPLHFVDIQPVGNAMYLIRNAQKFEWFDSIKNNNIYYGYPFTEDYLGLFQSFVYAIFDDIKNF